MDIQSSWIAGKQRICLYFLQTHLKFMVIPVILGIKKINRLAVIKNTCQHLLNFIVL